MFSSQQDTNHKTSVPNLAQLDIDHLFELYDPQFDVDGQGSGSGSGNPAVTENERPAKKQVQAFDRLVLQDGHRDMIVSLITQHFRDKAVATASREQVDIVKGKGMIDPLVLETAANNISINVDIMNRSRTDRSAPWSSWSREDIDSR